jgi:hypothetical protein
LIPPIEMPEDNEAFEDSTIEIAEAIAAALAKKDAIAAGGNAITEE